MGPPGLVLRGKHTAKLLEAAPHRVDVWQPLVLNLTVWVVFCMREKGRRERREGGREKRRGNVAAVNKVHLLVIRNNPKQNTPSHPDTHSLHP